MGKCNKSCLPKYIPRRYGIYFMDMIRKKTCTNFTKIVIGLFTWYSCHTNSIKHYLILFSDTLWTFLGIILTAIQRKHPSLGCDLWISKVKYFGFKFTFNCQKFAVIVVTHKIHLEAYSTRSNLSYESKFMGSLYLDQQTWVTLKYLA